jgi:hypothetical protein
VTLSRGPQGVIAGLPLITTIDNPGGVLQFGASPLGGAEVLPAFPPLLSP